ncbi:hypothetical protein Syun_006639 [Stephania yunnanensis]|uniref:Uncharacterized protein n=1 Tax=Stephania yunnanensis TaxID=152371 RepID=A0AAP0PXT8_9MAGN
MIKDKFRGVELSFGYPFNSQNQIQNCLLRHPKIYINWYTFGALINNWVHTVPLKSKQGIVEFLHRLHQQCFVSLFSPLLSRLCLFDSFLSLDWIEIEREEP